MSADIELREESALAQAQSVICSAMRTAGITKAELARRIGCSKAFITQSLDGDSNLTVKTMARFLSACGLEIGFKTIVPTNNPSGNACTWAILFEDAGMKSELFSGEGAARAVSHFVGLLTSPWRQERTPMPEPLSQERIAEIKERAEKAAPGPWEVRYGGNFTDIGAPGFGSYCDEHHNCATPLKVGSTYWPWGDTTEDSQTSAEQNADFIANARTDIPDLCAELERLREENERLRTALSELACLGNEPFLGNSRGNVIAQKALAVSTETCGKERG